MIKINVQIIFPTVQTYTVVKFRLGGLFMDYKKEIIKMIDEIESQKILRYIYLMLLDIPKRYWR